MVTTVYGDTDDGYIRDTDASWANLDVGGASLPSPTVNTTAGNIFLQRSVAATFSISQAFLTFDTSAVVTSTTASCFVKMGSTNTPNTSTYTARLLDHDWTPALAAADFIASSDFTSHTTIDDVTLADGVAAAYQEYTYGTPSLINTGGQTSTHLVCTDQATTPVEASDEMQWTCWMSDSAGTSEDPYLEIDESAAGEIGGAGFVGPVPVIPPPLMMGY